MAVAETCFSARRITHMRTTRLEGGEKKVRLLNIRITSKEVVTPK